VCALATPSTPFAALPRRSRKVTFTSRLSQALQIGFHLKVADRETLVSRRYLPNPFR